MNIASVNDVPVAVNVSLNTSEDIAVNGSLSASDVDGDALSYAIIANATKGVVEITNITNGAFTYTPTQNATGVDSFTFTVNDGLVNSNTATVSVNITALNDAPIANNGNLNTNEDVAANGVLSASDADDSLLFYSIVTNGGKGTAVITNVFTGDYTYTPNPDASGTDSFTFKANDGQINSNIATVIVNVAALNDAPIANNDNLNTSEDVAINSALSASDIDGDALSYTIIANATKGVVEITNITNGAFTYTPNPNATGVDSFTFIVNDGLVNSNTATISVSIAALNDAPVANNGNLNTTEDLAANGMLSATDTDSNALIYSIVSNGSKGTAAITNTATGAYIYTPDPDATGVDSFTFKANDGLLDSNIATISVNVTALNDAPIANNANLNTTEDVAANGVLSASDIDGDSLIYVIIANATKGEVVITNTTNGDYTYSPNPDAAGVDSFTFKVNDGLVNSNAATVSVSITAVNDAPVASNGNLNTSEDVAVNGVLSASDADGDALIYSIVSNGGKGTAVITNAVTGDYTYTPNPGATGSDSFTFNVNDGQVDSNIATITVNLALVNDAPVAQASTLNTDEDVAANGVLNATDTDSNALIYSIVSNASKGTAAITNTATGAYIYTPNPNATGDDSFTFKVNDGQVDSNTATVSVSIAALNDAPIANNGNINTTEDVAASGVLNASDADGNALNYSIVSNGSAGTAAITNTATGAYIYTPNPDATGSDSFTFKANDGLLNSSTAIVSVSITAVNDAPVANNGNLNTSEDVTVNGVFSASDVDGNALIYSIVSNGGKGTVTITNAATGAYTYTPNAGAIGTDSFTFKVNDGLLDSNIATIIVNLALVNDTPIADGGTLNTDEDVVTSSVLNASDIDGDTLSYTIVSNGSNGTAVITNAITGAYIYTPNPDANGDDSFTFKVNDGQVDSNTAIVSVSIAAVNDVPVARSVSFSIVNNETVTGTLDAFDADGDVLIYSLISIPRQGVVVPANASIDIYTYTYIPNPGATGTDSFTYSVSDGQAVSNIATVTIEFQEVNVAKDESASSGGSLNLFFLVLLSLLSGLRIVPVGRVVNRKA